ncbi:M13 family metallopeptidase [Mucilaginibacter sp. HMF5004]|uniref:M13 family metallopeptidase n=1 Tax=Mucilaginibacter rivuli TaxID=2857527 RepID=UPI001C5D20AD|nr:M13 family metallopeptidase [Mucilaginibacter rivuli]MBW4889323.1 M13 family metallopeptidase [Mucilaginibacter rivuli]
MKQPNLKLLYLGVTALAVFSTSAVLAQSHPKNDPIYQNLDKSVKPGTDFFMYANGTWLKNNPIPPAYSSWGIGNVVGEDIRDRLKKINESAIKANAPKGSSTQKIGDFYYSGLDSVTIEKLGINALSEPMGRIDKISTVQDILDVTAYFNTIGVRTFAGARAGQDDKNSAKMILQTGQGGLGLPNREYYFKTDARTVKIRTDYTTKYVPAMLKLSGLSDAQADAAAKSVFAIEKALADSSRKLEELRDPYRNYNKMSVAQFNKLTPAINWNTFFGKMGIIGADSIIIGQPEFFRGVNKYLTAFSVADWKAYLRWKLISSYAPYLNDAIVTENFRFTGTVLQGRKTQLPRWKSVLDTENGIMGELLGQLFVKEYFPLKAKMRYAHLVEAIRQSYREHIAKLTWMSPETKKKALVKLNAIHPKVGYPDKWKDFSTLQVSRESYAANVMQARKWAYQNNINKLGKPIDHTEWNMTPQTYNANYSPSNNEITLPAAQFIIPGIMDADIDDAVVYGYSAASTIGHEITHGFDDEGRQYDAKGNLKSWWTKADSVNFTKRAQMLADQFSSYVVLDSLHVNGQATLGENIADLGGIVLGLDAFKKTKQYKEGKTINGLKPIQRFFLGYAIGWLGQRRDEALAQQINTDVHAPGFLRVNGPFSDVPEFYAAFGVKKGDPMWLAPEKRVKIW